MHGHPAVIACLLVAWCASVVAMDPTAAAVLITMLVVGALACLIAAALTRGKGD